MHIRAIENTSINTPQGPRYMEGAGVTDDGRSRFGDVAQVADTYIVNPRVFEVVEWVPDPRGGPGGVEGSGYYRALEFPVHGVRYMKFQEAVETPMAVETFVAGLQQPTPIGADGEAPTSMQKAQEPAPKRRPGRPRKQPQAASAAETTAPPS